MAKLKTVVIHAQEIDLVAGEEVALSEELVAEEDMKIVGCVFSWTRNLGNQTNITVCRGGTFRESGGYMDPIRLRTTDAAMFVANVINPGSTTFNRKSDAIQMLPAGHYFELEKDERLYVHFKFKNWHSSTGYSFGADAILYYY